MQCAVPGCAHPRALSRDFCAVHQGANPSSAPSSPPISLLAKADEGLPRPPASCGSSCSQDFTRFLAGFTTRLSSTLFSHHDVSDSAYAEKYGVNELFAEMKRLVLRFKPVDPTRFCHDMLHFVVERRSGAAASDTTADAKLAGSEASDGDAGGTMFCGPSLPSRRAVAVPAGSPLSAPPQDGAALAFVSPSMLGTGHRQSKRSLHRQNVVEELTSNSELSESDQYVHVSINLRKPLLLRQPTFGFRFLTFFGLDIGGSLCKLTFFEPNLRRPSTVSPELSPEALASLRRESSFITSSLSYGSSGTRDPALSFSFRGGRFHFIHFDTSRMGGAIKLIKEAGLTGHAGEPSTDVSLAKPKCIMATGGGAFKFAEHFRRELGVRLVKHDELVCLLTGLNFMLQNVPDECYFLEQPSKPLTSRKVPYPMTVPATNGAGAGSGAGEAFDVGIASSDSGVAGGIFPYLLVNCGSGVSMLRVDSPYHFERVGGTCIGGGTFLGLCRLYLNTSSYSDAMKLCESGDRNKVDMLVGDIYGGDYETFGLKASTVASAFGKMVMRDNPTEGVLPADIASSLLHLITINIGQVAYLTAQAQNLSHILFAGNFLRNNMLSAGFLSYSINYWSQGTCKALFLKHEGFFGAVGALLLQGSENAEESHEDGKK